MSDDSSALVPFKEQIKFLFDTSSTPVAVSEMAAEFEKLEKKINRYINEPRIGGHPIVQYVLKMMSDESPDWDEVAVAGAALSRLADLFPTYMEMKEKMDFINFGRKNPGLAAWAFGGFDGEIDKLIEAARTEGNTD